MKNALDITYEEALAFFENKYRTRMVKEAKLIKKYISPVDYWDVGANIGFFSHCLLQNCPSIRNGVLFEPIENLWSHSKKLLKPFSDKLIICDYGLSDYVTDPTATKPPGVDSKGASMAVWSGGIGGNTLVTDIATSKDPVIKVALFHSGEEFESDKPDFIKVDIEGHEAQFFKGLIPSLERTGLRPSFMVELGLLREFGMDQTDEWTQYQKLIDMGYECVDFNRNKLDFRSPVAVTNAMFLP